MKEIFIVSTFAVCIAAAGQVQSKEIPTRYRCGDGSRVFIAEDTGDMKITPPQGGDINLPFAGFMSSHGGFGKHTECYPEDAPCAEVNLQGQPTVWITLDQQRVGIKCTAVGK